MPSGENRLGVPPPRNGAILRVVDFAPYDGKVPQGIDHHEILKQMGIDPATQGYQRHIFTHRTRSIDYAIVLEGEIDMLLDDSEVHLKAGDILVIAGKGHEPYQEIRGVRHPFSDLDAARVAMRRAHA